MLYEFNTANPKNEDENEEKSGNEEYPGISSGIIILIIIMVLILAFFLFFIIWRKIRIKSGNLENKVNDTNFSSRLSEDLNDNKELSDNVKDSGSYINAFL